MENVIYIINALGSIVFASSDFELVRQEWRNRLSHANSLWKLHGMVNGLPECLYFSDNPIASGCNSNYNITKIRIDEYRGYDRFTQDEKLALLDDFEGIGDR